jgi:hypothetical protein
MSQSADFQAYPLKFIREPDDEQLVEGERMSVLRISMGGNKAVGFYFTFRGDPEQIIELAEMMAAGAKKMLGKGNYLDNRS